MRCDLTDRLEAQFDSHTVVRQLHDVPPHEVYEIIVNGQRAVYKGNTGSTGNAGIEGRIMGFVGKYTSIPVPEVLAVEDEFFVAAWHDHAPSPKTDQEADENWARAAGSGLARLHNESAQLLEKYGPFRPNGFGIDGHDDWHDAAVEYVRTRRPILSHYGHADVIEKVLGYLGEHPDAFAGADEPVCCHGWATPEHVTVADEDVVCMVDFEHAIAAPGEYDYWRTAFPAFESHESAAHMAFRESYESVRPLPAGFERRRPYYALLNGVYYFESLYVQAEHGPKETAAKAQRLRGRVTEVLNGIANN